MARVTVEDCVEKVINRFELVTLAAERAKKINSGSPITIDRDDDKDPVVALREIAEGYNIEVLRESLTSRLQKLNKVDEIEDDEVQLDDEGGDDFEYVADGSGFMSDDDVGDIDSEEGDGFDGLSEEAIIEQD